MTRVLLRLKLALTRNAMRPHAGRLDGVFVAYGVALLCGVASGGLLLAARGAGPGGIKAVALAIPTVPFFGWLVGPLMASGFDSAVDPAKLAIYPLTSRQMTVGLFAVACVGGGGVYSALAVAGLLGATAPIGPLALASVTAALCLVAVCVAASRAAGAVISGASRRVRDALLFIVPVLFMSLGVLPHALQLSESDDPGAMDLGHLAPMAEAVATALPSGPAAQSLLASAQGRPAAAMLWLVPAFAWVMLMLWIWSLALRRFLVRAVSAPAAGANNRRAPASTSLYQRPVRWLPRSRLGAVAAKELRLTIRDPRQRVALLGSVVGAVPFTLIGLSTPGPSTALRVCAVSFFVGANATNLYGFDGGSHWMNIAAGDDARSDVAGKCVARALIVAPVVLVLVMVTAGLVGAWSRALPAMALAFAGLGLGLGPAAWVSVVYPWPMPPAQKNIFAGANTGQGFQAIVPLLGITLVGGAVLLGIGIPMARRSAGALALAVLSLLAVVIGAAAFAFGLRRAVARSGHRQPELLLALTKG